MDINYLWKLRNVYFFWESFAEWLLWVIQWTLRLGQFFVNLLCDFKVVLKLSLILKLRACEKIWLFKCIYIYLSPEPQHSNNSISSNWYHSYPSQGNLGGKGEFSSFGREEGLYSTILPYLPKAMKTWKTCAKYQITLWWF